MEATKHIRANPELTTMSIIALTALNLPVHCERCLDAGADEYLCKPISPHTLAQAIEAQLQQKATDTAI